MGNKMLCSGAWDTALFGTWTAEAFWRSSDGGMDDRLGHCIPEIRLVGKGVRLLLLCMQAREWRAATIHIN